MSPTTSSRSRSRGTKPRGAARACGARGPGVGDAPRARAPSARRRAPAVRGRRTSRARRARLPAVLRDHTPTPRSAWSGRRCTGRVLALVNLLRKLARLGPAIELLARQRTCLAPFARFDASAHVGLLVGRKAHARWEPRPGCHVMKPSSIRRTRNPGSRGSPRSLQSLRPPGRCSPRWSQLGHRRILARVSPGILVAQPLLAPMRGPLPAP